MASNFYAIAKGKKTGVFTSWDEAKTYIQGYSGAKYKGFMKREDADKFVENGGEEEKPSLKVSFIKPLDSVCRLFVDVEDSCSTGFNDLKAFRSICVVDSPSKGIFASTSWAYDEDYQFTNRHMEILALGYANALAKAYKLGYREFLFVYTNASIEKYATSWNSKSKYIKYFKEALSLLQNKYDCIVNFEKFDYDRHPDYRGAVKHEMAKSLTKDSYVQFGFKNEL